MGKKISDSFFGSIPDFGNRYVFARVYDPDGIYSESKYGYLDGADECIEGYKSLQQLKELVVNSTGSELDEYETAYYQAIKDFIKYKEEE